MRILVMNGSGGDAVLALVERAPGGLRLVRQAAQAGRGGAEAQPGCHGAEALPGLLRALLRAAAWPAGSLDLIAAVTGPGSFTGLRATLALAHGLALGTGAGLQGVAIAEALRRTLRRDDDVPADASMPLWYAGMARRDRVFLERCERRGPEAFKLDALPRPEHAVLLAGDASRLVAERIGQAGGVARCSGVEQPDAGAIALVGLDRHEGRLPPLAALPLYVDAPEARLPAGGLRPPPS